MPTINEMLAEHDRRYEDPLVAAGVVSEPRYGPEPRTEWPPLATGWTEADRDERAFWVRRLYVDDGLAISIVARRLNINRATVDREVVRLGIRRADGKLGRGTDRSEAAAARRVRVKEIFEERRGRVTGAEIARMVGASPSTVQHDMAKLGLSPVDQVQTLPGLDRTVGRAVNQLTEMAGFLLDHPDLHLLVVDDATASAWRKQLTQVVKAVNRVRKHLPQEES